MTKGPASGAAIDLDPDGVFSLHPEVVVAAFDDQVLLYHLNKGRALTLNQTAGIILQLIDSRCTTAEIREVLREAFPESADEVESDVDRTLRYLLKNGALDASSPDAEEAMR